MLGTGNRSFILEWNIPAGDADVDDDGDFRSNAAYQIDGLTADNAEGDWSIGSDWSVIATEESRISGAIKSSSVKVSRLDGTMFAVRNPDSLLLIDIT